MEYFFCKHYGLCNLCMAGKRTDPVTGGMQHVKCPHNGLGQGQCNLFEVREDKARVWTTDQETFLELQARFKPDSVEYQVYYRNRQKDGSASDWYKYGPVFLDYGEAEDFAKREAGKEYLSGAISETRIVQRLIISATIREFNKGETK